jgi:Domain of unknown function (DUF4436)
VTDPQVIPKPRRVSRRGWIAAAIIGVVVIVMYVLVAAFYDIEGGLKFVGAADSDATGVLVHIDPVSVDPQHSLATVHLALESRDPDLVDPTSNRLTQNTRILITSAAGSQEFRYPAGETLGQVDIQVGLAGEQAKYPFDSHFGTMSLFADTYEKGPDGSFVSTGVVAANAVEPAFEPTFGVNGWDTILTAQNLPGSSVTEFDFRRAFSTQIFAVALLVLVVVLSSIALTVGLLTVTRRRRVEVGLLTYAGALLFALPALRQYMPNAPPIGAAIDIYVYLWAIVGAIAAITLLATSWIAQTRTSLILEREKAKADAKAERRLTGD